MSVDVRQGGEVFVAVGAAVDGAAVGEQCGLTHLVPAQWGHYYIQPAKHADKFSYFTDLVATNFR